jgi:hypothetical protein
MGQRPVWPKPFNRAGVPQFVLSTLAVQIRGQLLNRLVESPVAAAAAVGLLSIWLAQYL